MILEVPAKRTRTLGNISSEIQSPRILGIAYLVQTANDYSVSPQCWRTVWADQCDYGNHAQISPSGTMWSSSSSTGPTCASTYRGATAVQCPTLSLAWKRSLFVLSMRANWLYKNIVIVFLHKAFSSTRSVLFRTKSSVLLIEVRTDIFPP